MSSTLSQHDWDNFSDSTSIRVKRNFHQRETTLEPVVSKLERFVLYETHSHMYLVGCDKLKSQYRVLKMDRGVLSPKSLSDFCIEDPNIYSVQDMVEMLEMIHEGNRNTGGLLKVAVAFGIVGFIRFWDCFYLCLITQRRKVGLIGGNLIYAVKATETFPLRMHVEVEDEKAFGSSGLKRNSVVDGSPPMGPNAFVGIWSKVNRRLNPSPSEVAEARYLSLFQFIDLSKDFYFSYTYDLTNSLQHNITASTAKTFPPPPFKDMYAWNFYLTRELESLTGHLNSSFWVQPIIHGAFLQRRCNMFGRILTLTVIARRSRRFAGTRYLKRGVSDIGAVANDVEVEQVAHVEGVKEGIFSAFVQMRGSIPTYWTQESSMTMPKPPIVLARVDSTYTATQKHFADLLTRYSSPLLVLDLVKQSEKKKREAIVGSEYRKAIEYINSTMPPEHKIRYCGLDFSHISKHRSSMNLLKALEEVAEWAINQVGFFCSGPYSPASVSYTHVLRNLIIEESDDRSDLQTEGDMTRSRRPKAPKMRGVRAREQQGVLRTNCIDCLDRTNVAQFSVGVYALGCQLYEMGVIPDRILDSSSQVVQVLMDLYTELGDNIALQYGGSEAHRTGGVSTKQSGTMTTHKKLLTSIRRYYSNAFTDRVKQDAMNIFLGHYIPTHHEIPLWDMESDFYLHNFHVQNGPLQSMLEYKKDFYYPDLSCLDMSSIPEHAITFHKETSTEEISDGVPELGFRPTLTKKTVSTVIAVYDTVRWRNELKLKRARVAQIAAAQSLVQSQWWREGLQRYAQAKMWMHLGPPKQGQLPPRFDRIHQTNKLTSFNRIFSHEFTNPISIARNNAVEVHHLHRKRHSQDLAPVVEEIDVTEKPPKVHIHSNKVVDFELDDTSGTMGERGITIGHYVRELSERAKNILQMQMGSIGGKVSDERILDRSLHRSDRSSRYGTNSASPMNGTQRYYNGYYTGMELGNDSLLLNDMTPPQFVNYAKLAQKPEQLLEGRDSEDTVEEFKAYLSDFTVDVNSTSCVEKLKNMSEEGSCSRTLTFGPHKGLLQDVSAIKAATATIEQLDQLNFANARNLSIFQQAQDCKRVLIAQGLYSEGMENLVQEGLMRQEVAERDFSQLLNEDVLSSNLSSFVTPSTVDLYNSYFPHSHYDIGDRFRTSSIGSFDDIESASTPMDASDLFIQRDEDIFASQYNPYMVFNGPGCANAINTFLKV